MPDAGSSFSLARRITFAQSAAEKAPAIVSTSIVAESQSGGDGALPALDDIRCIFSYASHEEIGRFGSRVIAADIRPDILIAVDVNHDYSAAPSGMKSKRMPEIR